MTLYTALFALGFASAMTISSSADPGDAARSPTESSFNLQGESAAIDTAGRHASGGDMVVAAKKLGITEKALLRKIKAYESGIAAAVPTSTQSTSACLVQKAKLNVTYEASSRVNIRADGAPCSKKYRICCMFNIPVNTGANSHSRFGFPVP